MRAQLIVIPFLALAVLGCKKKKPAITSSPVSESRGGGASGGGATGFAAKATHKPPPGVTNLAPTNATVSGSPITATCDQKAHDIEGAAATAHIVTCPADCYTGTTWGTDVYTDDSAVCAAILHSGAIPQSGGKAMITFVPGQLAYIGSERNGVKSEDYAKWERSFFVQKIDASNKPTTAPPLVLDDKLAHLSCHQSIGTLGDAVVGRTYSVICSPCSEGTIYGTGVYTADSSVCAAATHSGLAKTDDVMIQVTIGGKKDSFKGTEANGLSSADWGAYDKTFTLTKL
jgi:hypothetical protein